MTTRKLPFQRTFERYMEQMRIRRYLKNNSWSLSRLRASMLMTENADMCKNYLPISVNGLTILDIGAGEGESALFYLSHGAKHIIAVEASPSCFNNLITNATRHPITPIMEPFKPSMLLNLDYDFLKMDIEGYEESILNIKLPTKAVIEVHGLQLRDKFAARGYRIGARFFETSNYWAGCTAYAFWKC